MKVAKRVLFLIALIFYAASYLAVGNRGTNPGDAVNFYAPLATHIAQGDGYVLDHAFPDRYPPGFPLFLAAIYRTGGTADLENTHYRWAIVILHALSVTMLFLAARQWLTASQATIAALLLMMHPVFAALGVTRFAWNATALFLFFFVASLWLLFSALRTGRRLIMGASGIALAASVLTWPAPTLFPLIVMGFIAIARPGTSPLWRVASTSSFLLGFALPVLTWVWIVYQHTGHGGISGGLYPSMLHGLFYRDGALGNFALAQRALAADAAGQLQNSADVAVFYLRQLTQHPLDLLAFVGAKTARAWYASIAETNDIVTLIVQAPYLLLGIHGARICLRRHRAHALFLIGGILYFWLTAVSVLAVVRYMMPAVVMLLMFAAVGAEDLWKRVSRALTVR